MSEYQQLFKYIAFALKCSRKRRGLRQIDVAQMAGINPRHYQRIESGTLSNLTIETLYCITQVLDINLADIFYKFEHSKVFTMLGDDDYQRLPEISPELEKIVAYLRNEVTSHASEKVADVYAHLKPNLDHLDSIADYSGLILGTDVRVSDATHERYLVDKEFILGKYNHNKNHLMQLTHDLGENSGSFFVVKQLIDAKGVRNTFVFGVAVLTQHSKLPLHLFAGIDCAKFDSLENRFDNFLIDKITQNEAAGLELKIRDSDSLRNS